MFWLRFSARFIFSGDFLEAGEAETRGFLGPGKDFGVFSDGFSAPGKNYLVFSVTDFCATHVWLPPSLASADSRGAGGHGLPWPVGGRPGPGRAGPGRAGPGLSEPRQPLVMVFFFACEQNLRVS